MVSSPLSLKSFGTSENTRVPPKTSAVPSQWRVVEGFLEYFTPPGHPTTRSRMSVRRLEKIVPSCYSRPRLKKQLDHRMMGKIRKREIEGQQIKGKKRKSSHTKDDII